MIQVGSAKTGASLPIGKGKKFPSEHPDQDLELIMKMAEKGDSFKDCMTYLNRVDLERAPQNMLLETISKLLESVEGPSDECELYNLAEKFLFEQRDVLEVFSRSVYFVDLMISKLRVDSSLAEILLDIQASALTLTSEMRTVRQAIFRFAAIRREGDLCFSVIKHVSVTASNDDFMEFSGYCTSIIPLVANDVKMAKDLFNYLMNIASLLSGSQRIWVISFVTSFSPLVRGNTVHQCILDFVKFQAKPIAVVKKFEATTASLYNKSLDLWTAPPLLRPYHLYSKWHLDAGKLAEMKSAADVHNAILLLCRENYDAALMILEQLPIETSLTYYYVMASSGYEEEFHQAVEKALGDAQEHVAIKILEKCAQTFPALVQPHIKSISKFGMVKNSEVVANLIRCDIVEFRKLWKYAQEEKFCDIKSIIREGIIQVQRRSRSIENAKFITSVLRHYFGDLHGVINWGAVATEFSNDVDMVGTILLDDRSKESGESEGIKRVLKWRDDFMGYIAKAPAELHKMLVIPYLLLATGDIKLPENGIKWAVQHIPTFETEAEAILEGFVIYELAKNVLSQAKAVATNIFKDLFGFAEKSAPTYCSIFVHAVLAQHLGTDASIKVISELARSNSNIQKKKGAIIAMNILRICDFPFSDEDKEFSETHVLPLVDVIMSIISPSAKEVPMVKLTARDGEIVTILREARGMVEKSLDEAIRQKTFKTYRETKLHILKVSVACFLLLPSRSVSSTSISRCMELITGPGSTTKHKNFGLLALSRSTIIPDIDYYKLLPNGELHKSLCVLAVRQNNLELIYKIFKASNDFTILENLKSVIVFLNEDELYKFIARTAPTCETSTIMNMIDGFPTPPILFAVFHKLRGRSMIHIFQKNQYQKLHSAIKKFSPNDIKDYVMTPFDDFALLCSLETECGKAGSLCWNLITDSKVTLPALFCYCFKRKNKMREYIDTFLAVLLCAQEDQRVDAIIAIGVMMLVGSTQEPFSSIITHYWANPNQLTREMILSLIPSLFAAFPSIDSTHLDVISQITDESFIPTRDEIISCLKLKKGM